MDEMKLKVYTKFMRNIVSKLVSRSIYKKYGYKIDICIKELDASIIDGETNVNANVEIKLNSKEFMKIIKTIGMD